MSILDLFRQPKEATGDRCDLDPDLVKSRYRYWRFRIFYSMYVGYSVYYFTRKSLTYAAPTLIAALHLDKTDYRIMWNSTVLHDPINLNGKWEDLPSITPDEILNHSMLITNKPTIRVPLRPGYRLLPNGY